MKLLVLDGNSIANRAFYGIKLLTTKDGRPTNAVYGFMNIFLRLLEDEKPDRVAVAFDLKGPTFRHKMYDGYKAQRKGMPDDLAQQMPVLRELLAALGYTIVTAEGWEADDILGTLAQKCFETGDECAIATGDRDSLQLVRPGVRVLLAGSKMGRPETTVMDEAAIREKYGLEPIQLIEVKALMGDASDNIPGVAGIGEKTALALIQKFGSVEGVYQNLDDPFIKPGQRAKLEAGREQVALSRRLGTISAEAPVPLTLDAYAVAKPAPQAAGILAGLEMYKMIDRLGLRGGEKSDGGKEAEERPKARTLELLEPLEGDVYIAPVKDGYALLSADKKVYLAAADSAALQKTLCGGRIFCFDAKPLYALALKDEKRAAIVFDAKLAAYLLNPAAKEYTVERLAQEYDAQAAKDAPGGVTLLPALCEKLQKEIEAEGMEKLLREIELPLAEVLADMELTGVEVDSEGIRAFGAVIHQALETELAAIYDMVGYEFNVNSPKQLGEALFDKLGLPTRKKTKSGYSTNAETLESLRAYSPAIDHILAYRTYQKLYSTYVEGLLKVVGQDGRIHSTFNQTETRTGRISSGEPNLQNIPVRTELGSQLRRYFVAKKGCLLLDADYSQIELRLLAHISGDETMKEAFRTGKDIHRSTAARIYDMPPEKITPQLRSSAKAVNFGIVYGIGAFSLSKDIGVTVREADRFIKNYLDNFSGVREYMERTIAEGREKGYVTTLYGRRRALPELQSSNFNIRSLGERMAMNTPIQGTAADIIKLAMVRVWRRLREEGLKARLVLQVHDELIVEAPAAEKKKAAKILGEEMKNAAELSVPLTADVSEGTDWYAAKS
ncbi:MAG: DNA polymerase I [Oscillospiraceae bacterium]|nr:DNA polymerase I [Oscillospiraceae bacterium]